MRMGSAMASKVRLFVTIRLHNTVHRTPAQRSCSLGTPNSTPAYTDPLRKGCMTSIIRTDDGTGIEFYVTLSAEIVYIVVVQRAPRACTYRGCEKERRNTLQFFLARGIAATTARSRFFKTANAGKLRRRNKFRMGQFDPHFFDCELDSGNWPDLRVKSDGTRAPFPAVRPLSLASLNITRPAVCF